MKVRVISLLKTYVQMLIIFGIVVVRCRLIFSETEVAATAAAATTIATGYDTANDETGLQTIDRKKKKKIYCRMSLRRHRNRNGF